MQENGKVIGIRHEPCGMLMTANGHNSPVLALRTAGNSPSLAHATTLHHHQQSTKLAKKQGEAMASEFKTFRLRLRAETASAHQKLEEQLKSTGLTGNRDDYAGMLSSFLRFYRPLEAALDRLEWQPHGLDLTARRKSSWLEGDLRALGHHPDNVSDWPNLPTLKSASEGLGALYVIEGASLGGQVIGRWLATELDINTNNGGRFFASYGAHVGEMWRSFLEVLERAADLKSNADSIEQSAIETFESFHDCLCAQHDAPVTQRLQMQSKAQ
jgi:heme oxygenase (biliverdin-IX-beta and delta-forming)